MPPAASGRPRIGLASLMRRGTVTELLFLFECTVAGPTRLRPIAERLGLTVQAASHAYRRLAARGLAEFRDGHYRATVRGIDWLHAGFGDLSDDLAERAGRLHPIRSCRAVALEDLAAGDRVTLELAEGLLGARRGATGSSTGRVALAARRGRLVRVDDLEGIVPLPRGRVRILTIPGDAVDEAGIAAALRRALEGAPGLLAAEGLEPVHLVRRVTARPLVRFGVGPACREAARVGVDSTVVLLEEELPRFLEQFTGPDPPSLSISRLRDGPVPRSLAARRHR